MFRIAPVVLALVAFAATPALAIPTVGSPAPEARLTGIDNKPVSVAALKGSPVYLNFFATWCGPCRVETPDIVRFSKQYVRRGLHVIGIDAGESATKAANFVHEFGIPYRVAADPDTTLRASYGEAVFFPIHVFIDRRGIVRTFRLGEMSASEIETAIKGIVR